MDVGAVLCARLERSGEWVHGAGAERLSVAMPCGAQRSMAWQRLAMRSAGFEKRSFQICT